MLSQTTTASPRSLQTRLAVWFAAAGSQVMPTAGSFQMSAFSLAAITSGSLSPWGLSGAEKQLLFHKRVGKMEFCVHTLLLIFFAIAFHVHNSSPPPLQPQTHLPSPTGQGIEL